MRRERDGIRRYVHLSSGNANSTTARTYTDIGFMACDEALATTPAICSITLTGYSRQEEFRKFLVAPMTIQAEVDGTHPSAKRNSARKGEIIFKCNSLVDGEMIRNLSQGVAGGGENRSHYPRHLRTAPGHSRRKREYSGDEHRRRLPGAFPAFTISTTTARRALLHMGSADLMPRNLDRRVEVLFPIEDADMQTHIVEDILAVCLRDTAKSHILQSDGRYMPHAPADGDGLLFNISACA